MVLCLLESVEMAVGVQENCATVGIAMSKHLDVMILTARTQEDTAADMDNMDQNKLENALVIATVGVDVEVVVSLLNPFQKVT